MNEQYKVINCGSQFEYGVTLQVFDNKQEAEAYVLKLGDRSILAKVIAA